MSSLQGIPKWCTLDHVLDDLKGANRELDRRLAYQEGWQDCLGWLGFSVSVKDESYKRMSSLAWDFQGEELMGWVLRALIPNEPKSFPPSREYGGDKEPNEY